MLNEFEFIDDLKSKYFLDKIGDDCAVLPKDAKTDVLITADMLVEDIDFRLEWTTPEMIGAKSLGVSLSDIAAMGGDPKWAMLSIGIPEKLWQGDFVTRFYAGWFTLARHLNIELVGGDVSRTPEKIVIDSIVAGEVDRGKAVLRSGANAGDYIYVTGSLGGAAGGLMLLESGLRHGCSDKKRKALIERQLRPTPQLEIGKQLLKNKLATSMIDLSDGLSSDLVHLCRASGVGAKLYSNRIPVNPNLSTIAMNADSGLGFAINGGEDFELLFTSRERKISAINDVEIHNIGEVTANAGIIEICNGDEIRILQQGGFRHF